MVNLSAYTGTIKVRLRAVAAGGYRGDMAIDDIEVIGSLGSELVYGDATGDGVVTLVDLAEFLGYRIWPDCDGAAELDLNDDCIINFHEFSMMTLNWLEE